MKTIDICAYCSSMGDDAPKQVAVWEETGELVCYECRVDFVEQEFDEERESRLPEDIQEKINMGISF